jgi:hypothetical protein
MKHVLQLAFLVIALFALPAPAHAADPATVYGGWIEKLPTGNSMVTEFTPTQMTSYRLDAAGNKDMEMPRFSVSYKDLSPTTIGVDFQGSGGVMLIIKDSKTLVMDFPGQGARTLTRFEGN